MESTVRDPKAVRKAVLSSIKKLTRGKEDGVDASIAQVTEGTVAALGRDISKTSVYRMAQALAKDGEISMSHEGARRNPFHFSVNGGGTPVETEGSTEEVLPLNFEQKLGNIVAQYKLIKEENSALRAENDSLRNELQTYRKSLERVDNILQIAV